MKNRDLELIQRVHTGDEDAFTELVKKYQKPVHALVWRKIGDFHIAEELTQDTFLIAYKKLGTLKKPQRFASWLYVIATRRCLAWLRKKRIWMQSLEGTSSSQYEKATYSQYIVEENERTAVESQRDVVKKLLAKLPESERTVITMHYFSEMSSAEIGAFLGVSANTIRSRLRRAQQRLKQEETMIREALDHFQISPNLTDNIMQEIARLKPGASTGGKPLVPWAIAASSVVLIVLMLGIGSQYLARFQKPYSLDTQSDMTVELIDAPIVLNLEVKPDIQNRLGSSNALSESDNRGEKPDEVIFAAAQVEGEDEVSVPKQQWIESEPIKGSTVFGLLSAPEGEVYAFEKPSLYKLPADGKGWQYIFDAGTLVTAWMGNSPIAKWKNTLYIIPYNKLYASTDDGKTWELVYSWSEEHRSLIDLVLTEQAFYLAFVNGILRSEDKGKTWKAVQDGLIGDIGSIVKIQNTLFAGTDNGLYRLKDDNWQRLEFPVSVGRIHSVAVTKEKLYVVAKMSREVFDPEKASRLERDWRIFRSSNLGNSWTDITPTNAWSVKGSSIFFKLIAAGETLLAMEEGMVRSTDSGNTWMPVQPPESSPSTSKNYLAVALSEQIFYVGSRDGLHRSTDGGKSWHAININRGIQGQVDNLIAFRGVDERRNTPTVLYANMGGKIVKTADKGKLWKFVDMEKPKFAPNSAEKPLITQMVEFGGVIYAKGGDSYGDGSGDSSGDGRTRLYQVSPDGHILMQVQDMPIFDAQPLRYHLSGRRSNSFDSPESEKLFIERLQSSSSGATQFFKQLAKWDPEQPDVYIKLGFHGPFAVSDNAIYMEYNFKLFRWKYGDTEWSETGVEETVDLSMDIAMKDLKLAVSGDTVYVGKRDGTLLQSFDKGNNWKEIPGNLMFPMPVKVFKEIVFAGSTVYVATDAGVSTSSSGKQWQVVTDSEGTNLIMEKLTVDGTNLYGVTKNIGVYRLESGTWKQIVSEMPDSVTSLAVDGNTLYVGTQNRGMLHFNLEK